MPGHFHNSHHWKSFSDSQKIESEFTEQPTKKPRKQLSCDGLMHQHRVRRVGGKRVLNFGIHDDPLSQRHVRIFINVHVTQAAVVSQDGNPGLLRHRLPQAGFSSRHDPVNQMP